MVQPLTFKDSLRVSYKAKHSLILLSNNWALRYLSKWVENVCLHTQIKLHMNVYRNFIHIMHTYSKNWKQPRWSSIGVVHPYNGILFRNKKKWVIKPKKLWRRNLKCILLDKRSQPEKITFGMIATIWYSAKGLIIDTVKRSRVFRDL